MTALSDAETAERLRALTAYDVLSAYDGSRLGFIELPQVIRDGVVLPSNPLPQQLGVAGAVADVPIIFGTNKDEQKTFLFFATATCGAISAWCPRCATASATC